jgi:hypothetical protein
METAGRTLDDRELADAMKERGLGTPATRAEIIETLIRRAYLERQGRSLRATEKGIGLVERVHPDAKSAALTGEWEAELRRIERGQAELAGFMRRIEAHVRELVRATSPAAPLPQRLHELLRTSFRRQGRAAGHAHRCGEVAVLPAPRPRPRRHDPRRLAADRAHGGSGRGRRWGPAATGVSTSCSWPRNV